MRPQHNRHNRHNNYKPRQQNTTVANQAYTFNGSGPQPNVSYAPSSFNTGPTNQSWGPQFPTHIYKRTSELNIPTAKLQPTARLQQLCDN